MSNVYDDEPEDEPVVAAESPQAETDTVRMKLGSPNARFEVPDLGLVVTTEGTDIPADKAQAVRDAAKETPGTFLIEED